MAKLWKTWDHLAAEVADLLALQSEFGDAVGTGADVDDGAAEGFVEGGVTGAVALDAFDGAEAFLKAAPRARHSLRPCDGRQSRGRHRRRG